MVTINNIASGLINDYYNNATTASKAVPSTSDTTNTPKKDYTGTLVGKYLATETSETADAKAIFQKLSVDLGSDGKSITKDQLDSYISEAKSGKVTISDKELSSLKSLQKNWTQIADGGDEITYANVYKAGFKDTLTAMAPDEEEATDYAQQFADSTAAAYSKIVNAALSGNTSNSEKTSSLNSMLKTLLGGTTDENDDANANMVATITNLLANSKSSSTTEFEA